MNSSVINSRRAFNHSSSGSSPQLSEGLIYCTFHYAAYVFLFIEKSINLVVGYPANIMVMWLVAREKSDSSTSNHFIFSLALADAWLSVMIAICFFGYLTLDIGYFSYLNHFTAGIKNGSPLFLACICLDRYMAVVHPIVFTSIKEKKIRVAISMFVWGLVIANGLSRALLYTISFIQHHMYVGLILASFTIMVFCNVSIIWIVFHYLPVVVVSLMNYFPAFPEFCTIGMIIFSIKDFSCITQPLLYISQIKQLPWLKKLLCICCRSPSPEPHNVST